MTSNVQLISGLTAFSPIYKWLFCIAVILIAGTILYFVLSKKEKSKLKGLMK